MMPNLRDSLEFVKLELPREFLADFEVTARAGGNDRPRMAWIDALRVEYWTWKAARRSGASEEVARSGTRGAPKASGIVEPSGEFPVGRRKRQKQPKRSKRVVA
jgi:hypothetical protein